MAQLDIREIRRVYKERNTVHEKVYTTFSTFNIGGKHYIQIDTYGRSNRENPGKISQSIQLDEQTARYLFELLKAEYNF